MKLGRNSNVIRISGKTYEELKVMSRDADMSISELAIKLINIGLKHTEVREETVTRKTLVFKE